MNPSSPQQLTAEPIDDYDDGFDAVLPVRPRASYLTPLTALLMALILGGVGFYVGIRVEKADTSSSSGSSPFARAFSGAAGVSGSSVSGSSKTGSGSRTGFPGGGSLASRFAAGGFGASAGGTVGSISSVDGNTLYVKETSGNTVKVKLSSATKITKTESASRKKLYPGEEVVISGSEGSGGAVQATSVADSGAATGSSATGSSGGASGSTNNATSAIRSLFGGG